MSRFVVPTRAAGLIGGEPPDGLTGRIVKYVPAEIVAIYLLLSSSLASTNIGVDIAPFVMFGLMGIFCAATFAYMGMRAPAGSVRKAHLIVSPVAFLAWAYPISSGLLGHYFIGWVAVIAQALFLLGAAVLKPAE